MAIMFTVVRYLVLACCFMQFNMYGWVPIGGPKRVHTFIRTFSCCRIIARFCIIVFWCVEMCVMGLVRRCVSVVVNE